MGLKHYKIQLASLKSGRNVTATGGKAYVTATGAAVKTALYNKDGTTAVNPVSLTNGLLEFYTQDTVGNVDLYMQTPTGHGLIETNVVASGLDELYYDTNARWTELVIPFSITDTAAAAETSTGFTLPTNAVVQPMGLGVDVKTLQSTKTIDFGVLESESGGDANGFVAAASLAAAGAIFPALTVTAGVAASTTYGVLLADFTAGANSDDRGIFNRKEYRCDGTAHTISYTLSSGTTLAEGFLKIPYILPNV